MTTLLADIAFVTDTSVNFLTMVLTVLVTVCFIVVYIVNRAVVRRVKMKSAQTRGEVIEQFFKGYDMIGESEEGRTFEAFYRFLRNELATRGVGEDLGELSERDFWSSVGERTRESITGIRGANRNSETAECGIHRYRVYGKAYGLSLFLRIISHLSG